LASQVSDDFVRWNSGARSAKGALYRCVSTAKVSQRGQMSLPAELRHRWGIEESGAVAFIDLGDAALVLPGGIETAKAEVRRVLAAGAYSAGLATVDDPDLAL
jgi:bifunctional DNA-binding transcriptional regulator/antitoxin component of YhaV-PrlF toxin-antitoxin module